MKILSYNINGIRSFKNWDFINDNNFDIIGFQEIKYNNLNELKKYELKNYYCYWSIDTKKNGYSGVCIMTKYKPIDNIIDDNGRFIILEYEKIYIINIYATNAGEKLEKLNDKINFYNNLNNILKGLNKPIILFGDMNVAPYEIDVKNYNLKKNKPGFTNDERNIYISFMKNNNLIDIYRHFNSYKIQYTYFSYRNNSYKNYSGWRLDSFLCSNSLINKVKDVIIRDDIYMSSDHVPIILQLFLN